MTDVKADVEYKINFNDNAFLLDHKKFKLLEGILNTGSITDASKLIDVSYRTALNYINKIETALNVSVVSTSKGGKGGGGGAILTPEGRSILKECKKINAIMQLHRDVNEIETVVSDIDEDKGVMVLTKNDLSSIINLINISKKTIKNIKQNLFWAFFYNTLMIPIAIGVLSPFGIAINPMIASLAMVLSSFTVILNALRVKRIKL